MESRNVLKIIQFNVNSNFGNSKFENNSNSNSNNNLNGISNSVNFIGGSNANVISKSNGNLNSISNFDNVNSNINLNFNSNNNNNSSSNVVYSNSNHYNLNYMNSNHENSFVAKHTSGSAIIYKKNQELNFSTKISDSNSSLRELIGAYSINKKVIN